MKRLLALLAAGCFPLLAVTPAFQKRADAMIDAYAHYEGKGDYGYAEIAARLKRHEKPEWCSRRLQELLAAGPSGDVFWMFPMTAIAYLDEGQLTMAAREDMRRIWKTYMPYRGDTENHFLLYYSCLYLMSQLWPEAGPETWYTGKSSRENMAEARAWIEGWVKLTTTRGQGEYDSPHYMGVYLLPMSYLAAWAQDPAMKKRSEMMLDYLIADYAPENLDGLFVGAHSRVYEDQLVEKWNGVSSDFGWLWFGLGHPLQMPANYVLYYLLASAYEPPEILKHIATDRTHPYTHLERKRTRNRWRFYDELHGPVYKTTYVRKEYAVSSDQGGVFQGIQQHSWDVTWHVPDARGVKNTFFTMQPYSSTRELQTYFVFPPDGAMEGIIKSKKTYDSPDKLLGGSPYEKIVQDQDALIALYNIPSGNRFPQINGFFSKDLSEIREDASGWIFMRAGDATFIACRPLQPYSWKPLEDGSRRLFSPWLKNGVVVQVAPASDFRDLDGFAQAVKSLKFAFRIEPEPAVEFRSLRGVSVEFTFGKTTHLNGKAIDYDHWPLFGGPFLQADVDSEQLILRYGAMWRTLDFKKLTVTEEGTGLSTSAAKRAQGVH